MDTQYLKELFGLEGKVAVITGGGGVLCGAMGCALGRMGVKVAVLDISLTAAQTVVDNIITANGEAIAIKCDVLNKSSIADAAEVVLQAFGPIDILINGAGGNKKEATTNADMPFFDLPADAVQWVFNLNFIGTLLPSQVFGKLMAEQGYGTILNVSSMNAFSPLTRIPAYSAAKAAVSNFTQWLAVHMNQEYTPNIRVNALAPGFFLTDEVSGGLTPRGKTIIDQTPMGRFGNPEDLISTMLWLLSDGASFITGIVVPIDGGFNAFGGV
jgi:NAD(P)-dependent dehydrogenase (short-subunit alcohol dehydrogenase family)